MKSHRLTAFSCAALLILAGCGKHTGPGHGAAGCDLLNESEVEAIQGSHIVSITQSITTDDGLHVTNCVFVAADSSKSVSLTITASAEGAPNGKSATAAWEKIFSRFEKDTVGDHKAPRDADEEHESRREREKAGKEDEEAEAPTRIEGIGDEAFWSANRMGGSLYVLKKSRDIFIRVNLGGPDTQKTKLNRSKVLAVKALARL